MSGGVDSSVAAALIAQQGYEVIGVTMRMFDTPNEKIAKLNKSCCSIEDVEDARMVCSQIGAKHYFLNFVKEFEQNVIDYFVSEYELGRTPHPCLACNDRMKFDFLVERSKIMDADFVATGHYARIVKQQNTYLLQKGIDEQKDQSYVLYNLKQQQLKSLMFPIGNYSKDQIRDIARKFGLATADKPDSQDICFIPSGNYKKFIEPRINKKGSGKIVDVNGNHLGDHDGIHQYTIGQRKGINVKNTSRRPMYVSKIDIETGDVIVGYAEHLLHDTLIANKVNWISGTLPTEKINVTARIRYNGNDVPATALAIDSNNAIVKFENPIRAITPGQPVVFFNGSNVLGGGIIERHIQSEETAIESSLAKI
jgi:tRNA-specific 2-thiouridylase